MHPVGDDGGGGVTELIFLSLNAHVRMRCARSHILLTMMIE